MIWYYDDDNDNNENGSSHLISITGTSIVVPYHFCQVFATYWRYRAKRGWFGMLPGSWFPSLIARCMGPTWGPSGAHMTQVGPTLAPWTLLSGCCISYNFRSIGSGLIILSPAFMGHIRHAYARASAECPQNRNQKYSFDHIFNIFFNSLSAFYNQTWLRYQPIICWYDVLMTLVNDRNLSYGLFITTFVSGSVEWKKHG